ncbi:MAG: hypothetical protein E4H19_08870 [Chromatiales bacterium]|nr:MAG: hypothetical protein E4H19_08870 [Chromatiales bacterium]
MALYGSLTVVMLLIVIQTTVGHWKFLDRTAHSPWLSVSAGTALAYVFVYLLPKLAAIQEKISGSSASPTEDFLRVHVYLLALLGFVVFYWLGWASERASHDRHSKLLALDRSMILLVLGYSAYFAQLGYMVADLPRPVLGTYFLIGAVLMLHVLGINHGLRNLHVERYERLLRWVYAAATLSGWFIGIGTEAPLSTVAFWSAFTAGGIMITAIREELPNQDKARFLPFLAGATITSVVILLFYDLQSRS